jgi:hypothetical protein
LNRTLVFFGEFRCRSIAAAGDLHFFVSPKKPKEKKGDPTVCVPPLRCGQPAVLASSGVPLELAALRQSRALIHLKLRSSAQAEGVGQAIRGALGPLRVLNDATFLIAACARIHWAIDVNVGKIASSNSSLFITLAMPIKDQTSPGFAEVL